MVPIALLANALRVLFLVLVAYHLGDEAAAGILHAVAGVIVFVIAFAVLLGVDKVFKARGARPQTPDGEAQPSRPASHPPTPRASRPVPWGAALLLFGT